MLVKKKKLTLPALMCVNLEVKRQNYFCILYKIIAYSNNNNNSHGF